MSDRGSKTGRFISPKRNWKNYIEEKSIPEPNSGCWLWLGAADIHGYGRSWFEGKNILAHQLSWRLEHGQIPKGVCVCHRCDNPICVNLDHLFVGSQADNNADKYKKRRQAHGEKNGHARLTAADVITIRSDRRSCGELAKIYSVDRTTIHQARRKKTWLFIGDDNG